MSWQHIRPDSLAWQPLGPGIETRYLTTRPFPVRQYRIAPNSAAELQGLLLVQSGAAVLADGAGDASRSDMLSGDLVWRAHPVMATAGPDGCICNALGLPTALAPPSPAFVIRAADLPWQAFDDPAGRPTQPVQVLLEGPLSALRTRFDPAYEAGEHWHDFDTLYFITAGDMQFGFEGQYYAGDVRQVSGGFSYGPEKPGPQGVEFVLFSCGGPVNLHWSDLDAAPNGPLSNH